MITGLVVSFQEFSEVLLFLFHFVLSTAIVLTNGLVILAIAISKALKNENRFLYMMSTCVSDFGSGACWYYLGLLDIREVNEGESTCFVCPSFLGLSLLVILAAQADRYYAVMYPFHYHRRMSPTATKGLIASLWILAFLTLTVRLSVSSQIAGQILAFTTLTCNCSTMAIMIGLNVKLYIVAKFQLDRETPSPEREQTRSSVYFIVIVAATFLVIWLPVFLVVLLCKFTPLKYPTFRNIATDPFRIVPRLNCLLTPLLYIRGCRSLRMVISHKFCKCFPWSRRRIGSVTNSTTEGACKT